MTRRIRAVLFDLDGTVADTAPDLAAALNRLCKELGADPVQPELLRPHTSSGVRGMLGAGMGILPTDARYPALYERFLEFYADDICRQTALFPGVAELLEHVEGSRRPWGIVTNKQHRFTSPLVAALGCAKRAACVVSGDSAWRPKPHPAPMLLAAAIAGADPRQCVYVGDDLRDVSAGKAAGMLTVAVRYGYLGQGLPIEDWGADHIVDTPGEIAALLD